VSSLEEVDKMLDEAVDRIVAQRQREDKLIELDAEIERLKKEREKIKHGPLRGNSDHWETPIYAVVFDRVKEKCEAKGIKWEAGL